MCVDEHAQQFMAIHAAQKPREQQQRNEEDEQ
jgi:hypothetical protein